MTCSLVSEDEAYAESDTNDVKALCGTMVSSLHKLKDIDNRGAPDQSTIPMLRRLTLRQTVDSSCSAIYL